MKKLFKPVSLILAVLMTAGLLSGCTGSEMTLLEAYLKSASIKSMESSTEITMKIDSSELSEAAREKMGSIQPFLNEVNLNTMQNQ